LQQKGYQGGNPAFASRVCNEVMRNGIDDMDTLCQMLKRESKKLLQMRNIGLRSIEVISAVCSAYTNEKSGGGLTFNVLSKGLLSYPFLSQKNGYLFFIFLLTFLSWT